MGLPLSRPSKVDVHAYSTPEKPTFVFCGPIDKLESFKIMSISGDGVVFNRHLDVVGSNSHDKLMDMKPSSPNAIYHLVQPQFASISCPLITFKVDVREMRTEVDILVQFQKLENLEAFCLRLPTYPIYTDLRLVRTLKYMKIKAVPVQWMAGRTFPNTEECTIIWPHCPETLALAAVSTFPPPCTSPTPATPSTCFPTSASPGLTLLSSGTRCGTNQDTASSSPSYGTGTPARKLRSGCVCCTSRHSTTTRTSFINALPILRELDELHLGVVRPDRLGKKYICALQAKKGRSTRNTHTSTFCPSLKVFGIRYRYWLLDAERNEITPLLRKIVKTRLKTDMPLQSIMFWPTKDTPDEAATELCGALLDVGGEWDVGGGIRASGDGGTSDLFSVRGPAWRLALAFRFR